MADGDDKVLAEDLGLAGGHLLPVVEDAEEDAASLHLAAPVQLPVVVDIRFLLGKNGASCCLVYCYIAKRTVQVVGLLPTAKAPLSRATV